MLLKRKILLFLLIAVILILPELVSAQGIVPCGQGSDPKNACTLCHLIVGTQKLIDFGLKLLITVAAVAIFISGIMYIVSSGSEQAVTAAKSFLRASITGFTIVIMAWFLVNIVMWIISAKDDLGIKKANWYTFTCVTQSTTTSAAPPVPTTYPENTTPTPTGYTYDSGIQAQTANASAALNSLLNCMQPQLPDGAKRISSISDSAGMTLCTTNWSQPPCAHAKNSCHYGGTSCKGQSYAVDFGNEVFINQITSVATSCGGKVINEGNHIHVSVGSCGCDR